MQSSSPARLYATVVGTLLTIAGITGFFYSASFGSPGQVDALLGILDVNGWLNMVHLVTGLAGLVAVAYAAREYALGVGLLYLAVAIWGLVIGSGDSILGVVPVNACDNVLHFLLGVGGLAAGIASPTRASGSPSRGGAPA
jgi:Domain of unknown function (DUF4383)